jgi:hypothetical protein
VEKLKHDGRTKTVTSNKMNSTQNAAIPKKGYGFFYVAFYWTVKHEQKDVTYDKGWEGG